MFLWLLNTKPTRDLMEQTSFSFRTKVVLPVQMRGSIIHSNCITVIYYEADDTFSRQLDLCLAHYNSLTAKKSMLDEDSTGNPNFFIGMNFFVDYKYIRRQCI